MAYFKQIVWFLIDVKVHQLHNAVYLLTSYVGLLCCFMELCFHLWLESSKGTFISWQPVVCDRCHIKTVFTFKLRLDTFCGNLLASFNSITGLIKTVILWGFYLEQWHVKKKKKEKEKKKGSHTAGLHYQNYLIHQSGDILSKPALHPTVVTLHNNILWTHERSHTRRNVNSIWKDS